MMDIEQILSQMTLEEKAEFCSGHDFWRTESLERLGIASAMMCDGPYGLRKQEGAGDHLGINRSIETVCYPTASALAASFDREVMKTLGNVLGQECQAENVAMLLGPGLNIKRSPLCGRNFEYLSEDPYLARELASSYIQSLQAQGVAACVKHFAANNQETMRMSGTSQVDERTLREIYLPAFEAAVKQGGVRSVMCAYNGINGVFCSENKMLLTDILRGEWGLQGFVVTDWGAVKDRIKGLQAGLDLEMPGGTKGEAIVNAVKNGTLVEERLDSAVRNLLVFLSDWECKRRPETSIDRNTCRKISAELPSQCAVLLKNSGVLPLNPTQKLAFVGAFAEKLRYQGSGSSHINVPHAIGALEAATSRGLSLTFAQGYQGTERNDELLREAVLAARSADIAVVFAGLPDAYESEGSDRRTLAMLENQNLLIEAVCAVQPNTVVVLHGGTPMELPWLDKVATVLLMYLGGECVGEAAVRLLIGEQNPSGKLAETWPVKLADNPSWLNFPGVDGVVEYREGVFVGYRCYDANR